MTDAPARYSGREAPALERLREVGHALGPLRGRVVFIGGAIAPLLQTRPVSERVRPCLMLKWAAFRDRGEGDFHGSHDVEDIVALMASRPSLSAECDRITEPDVRDALAQMARLLFADIHEFGDLLAGHIKIEARGDATLVYRQVQEAVRALAHLDRNDWDRSGALLLLDGDCLT